ncbi:hypothetical protein HDV00_011913 [Rhizophlyctis rosea]|nr:hypothetical protein HDV00_011913 [Rhizophlyctis rosea]
MDEIPLSCYIVVDDVPLGEYQPENELGKTTCWIAAEEGKRYQISLTNDAPNQRDLAAYVYIDGKFADAKWLLPNQPELVKGARAEKGTYRPFMFGKLATTSAQDVDYEDDGSNKKSELSSINVKIWKCLRLQTTSALKTSDAVSSSRNIVNEKLAKKSKVMCDRITSFGEPEGTPRATGSGVDVRLLGDRPYYEFTFRYRSRDLLEAQDIIPKSDIEASQLDEVSVTAKVITGNKRNAESDLPDESDHVVPIRRKRVKPLFPKDEGILVDLEAPGGPVVSRNPVKKEMELVDLDAEGGPTSTIITTGPTPSTPMTYKVEADGTIDLTE